MGGEDREDDDDRATIVHNEATDTRSQQHDFHAVISNHKPKKQFIEPAVFSVFAGFTLYELLVSNTIELQYCRTSLNLTQDHCFSDKVDPKVKEEYEKFANTFNILRSMIEVTIPSIMSFFIGPWSDTYGRKPLIVSSIFGYGITYGLWTFASCIPTLPPMYFLLFSLPLAFTGGSTALILGIFCYVCDVNSLENRGWSLGRLNGVLFLGSWIGTKLYPELLPYGFTAVYGFASAFVYVSLIYVYFYLDESIVPSQVELNSPKKNPFHLDHVKELYECCFAKQSPKVRFTIFLLTVILSTSSINAFGESGIMYVFLQQVADGKLPQFTTLNSFTIIVNAVGASAGCWLLSKVLKLDDLLILCIAAFSRFLSAFVMIFGHEIWHIYLARLLSCTLGITGSIIRLFSSRIVPKDDLGKVFTLLASSESATPLVSTLVYSSLFNMTMTTIPDAIFYLSAFLILVMLYSIVILVAMYVPDSSGLSMVRPRSVDRNAPSINED